MGFGRWLHIVQKLAPQILEFTPLAPIASHVSIGIQEAEAIAGATGPVKLAHAMKVARAGIAATNAQAGHPIIDPTIADEAIGHGISTVVSVTNLVHRQQPEPVTSAVQFSAGFSAE